MSAEQDVNRGGGVMSAGQDVNRGDAGVYHDVLRRPARLPPLLEAVGAAEKADADVVEGVEADEVAVRLGDAVAEPTAGADVAVVAEAAAPEAAAPDPPPPKPPPPNPPNPPPPKPPPPKQGSEGIAAA